eukprot:1157455-Pelagomonas_calceolata.AAC.7
MGLVHQGRISLVSNPGKLVDSHHQINPSCLAQDAQNAVATRALFELFGEEQALHHSMAPPFKDMWLRWAACLLFSAVLLGVPAKDLISSLAPAGWVTNGCQLQRRDC